MNREILERYNKVFGVDNAEIIKTACGGKWSGSYDYSVRLGDSSYTIGNSSSGQKYLNDRLTGSIELYESFDKHDLLERLRETQSKDNQRAAEMGVNQYDILDVDFNKQGAYIGWFYVRLRVNGKEFNHLETGLHLSIVNYIKFGTGLKYSEKYYTAGGLSDSMVDYVFCGVGFSTAHGYKC